MKIAIMDANNNDFSEFMWTRSKIKLLNISNITSPRNTQTIPTTIQIQSGRTLAK